MSEEAVAVHEPHHDGRTLRAYFDDIGANPLLTPEEEKELARRKNHGDKEAHRRLVVSNLRFVVSIAKKYQNQGVPLEDLISEGNIGLLRAVDHFDLTFGVRFISYAVWWIRQAINSALHEQRNIVHIPLNRSIEHTRITQTEVFMQQSLLRNPHPSELAKRMHKNVSEVDRIRKQLHAYVSLDAPITVDEDTSVGDLLTDPDRPLLEEQLADRAMQEDVYAAVNTLDPKERKVVAMRFGLNGYHSMTLEEVGGRLKLSRERIRQIEQKALRRLKNPLRTSLREHLVA